MLLKTRFASMLDKDLKEALDKARKDERALCEKEKQKELFDQQEELNAKWSLKLQESESKVTSLEFRAEQHDKEKKILDKEKQAVRETGIKIRRIISDLVYVGKKKHLEDTKDMQDVEKLGQEIDEVEIKLIASRIKEV